MKKLLAGLIVLLAVGMTLPAYAVEMEYGGYWRTRAYTMDGFTGDKDDKSLNESKVDARGRLYNKAIINDEMSWTNRIEFNVTWGDATHEDDNGNVVYPGGSIGTDGTGDYIKWKHSFVDLDTEAADDLNLHFRIGLQPYTVAKGMLFDDDFAGLVVSYENESMKLPLVWMKVFEGGTLAGDEYKDEDKEDYDVDFLGFAPEFYMMDQTLTIKPFAFYLTSDKAQEWEMLENFKDVDLFYLGGEIDYTTEDIDAWLIGIYETGTIKSIFDGVPDFDFNSYLAAIGGEYKGLGDFGIHGQAFYASGDDFEDEDMSFFWVPQGQSYYWAEIMGFGVFDEYASKNSCADTLTNIIAYNLGLSYQATESLKLTGDVWYAKLAETSAALPEDELGTEVDLRADWMVNDKLMLTAVGAYLFAGDATTYDAVDPTDAWEIGLQLSFSFSSEE